MLLLLRLVLAAMFAAAGVAKLLDRPATVRAVADFGVPSRMVGTIALVVPLLELLTAVLVMIDATVRLGAGLAIVLLVAFTAAIARSIRRGAAVSCNCFGGLSTRPVDRWTLARNGGFAALAVIVAVAGQRGPGTVDAARDLAAGRAPGALLLVLQVVIIGGGALALRRLLDGQKQLAAQVAALRRSVDLAEPVAAATSGHAARAAAPAIEPGLPLGAPAPTFALRHGQGTTVGLDDLLEAARPVVLFFVSPTCVPCGVLLPQVAEWERVHGDRLTFVVISRGDGEGSGHAYAGRHLLLQGEADTAARYRASWTPATVHIDAAGRIASAIGYGESGAMDVVTAALATLAKPNGAQAPVHAAAGDAVLGVGDRFPVPLAEDGEQLVVFWSATCGYCHDLWPDLAAHQARGGGPTVVLSATSDIDTIAADTGAVVLEDADRVLFNQLGVQGTPSAVLVTADGTIRSEVAVGATDVLALAGIHQRLVPPVPVELGERRGAAAPQAG